MADNNIIKLNYNLDGKNFTVAGSASSDIKKVLKQLGVDPHVIRRVAISMYEGEINTIIHGKGGRAEVEIYPQKIVISFYDKGPGIKDVAKAMQEGFSTAGEDVRELGFGAGMGLPNIKKYSDDLQIDSRPGEGTTVVVTINI